MNVRQLIHLLIAMTTSGLILAGVWYVDNTQTEKTRIADTEALGDFAQRSASRLSLAINIRLQLTRLLAAIVTTDAEFATKHFDTIANSLIGDLGGILSLQLAPNGIVTYMTNVERNKAALGHDLLGDPKRKDLAIKAIKERRYVIAGPIKLKQGGRAVIARLPIFRGTSADPMKAFWGFATVLIDVPTLLDVANVSSPEKSVGIAIRGKDAKGSSGEVFYGNPETFENANAVQLISLPHGAWEIAVKREWGDSTSVIDWHHWFFVVGALLSALAGYGTYRALRYPIQLQDKISQATSDLHKAVQEAKEADDAKTFFLANMSHELRTPLNAILGFSQIMSRELLGQHSNPKYQQYSVDIQSAGEHLISIINDILDLSKIESGQFELNFTELALLDAVQSSITLSGLDADQNAGRVQVQLSKETPNVFSDARIFSQIMVNILSNADKFTPENGTIRIVSEIGHDGAVVVKVIDTGKGIPPQDLEKVMEPFGQVRVNVEISHHGTGIGLPLSKKLMEVHDGTLEIESKLGGGTTVILRFPHK